MPGYMDEARLSNIARYTANFTPATLPFCDASNATIRAEGGGAGGSDRQPGTSGASGGGAGAGTAAVAQIAAVNISGQGFYGGAQTGLNSGNYPSGGGGGAAGAGVTPTANTQGGAGGPGLQSAISGTLTNYACGGGGGTYNGGTAGSGGCTGAGVGSVGSANATSATASGSGGGGAGCVPTNNCGNSGAGANGEIWLVDATPPSTACTVTGAGNLVGQVNTNVVYQFTVAGTLTCGTARQINYVLVAGGGAGGNDAVSGLGNSSGAGGGAGGVRAGAFQIGTSAYTVTIGAGGVPASANTTAFGGSGGNSVFGALTATGGGGGGAGANNGTGLGQAGGSQGGTARATAPTTGNTVGQGNLGGSGYTSTGYRSGGGGGPGGPGVIGTASVAGNGGLGYFLSQNSFGNLCIAGGGAGGTNALTTDGQEGQGVCGGGRATPASTDTNAFAGSMPGSGGGGAGTKSNQSTQVGGAGAAGALYVSHPLTPSTSNVCIANTDGGGTDANVLGLWHVDQLTADSGRNIGNGTLGGTAVITNAQGKFGGYSLYTPTTTAYMGVTPQAWSLPGDFTIENWINTTFTVSSTQWMGDAGVATMQLYYNATNSFIMYLNATNRTFLATAPSNNAWHHLALVRQSGTLSFYIDGVSSGTPISSVTGTLGNGSANICWGSGGCPNGTWVLNGYVDEMRVSNMARYTSNFTPNALQFCDPAHP